MIDSNVNLSRILNEAQPQDSQKELRGKGGELKIKQSSAFFKNAESRVTHQKQAIEMVSRALQTDYQVSKAKADELMKPVMDKGKITVGDLQNIVNEVIKDKANALQKSTVTEELNSLRAQKPVSKAKELDNLKSQQLVTQAHESAKKAKVEPQIITPGITSAQSDKSLSSSLSLLSKLGVTEYKSNPFDLKKEIVKACTDPSFEKPIKDAFTILFMDIGKREYNLAREQDPSLEDIESLSFRKLKKKLQEFKKESPTPWTITPKDYPKLILLLSEYPVLFDKMGEGSGLKIDSWQQYGFAKQHKGDSAGVCYGLVTEWANQLKFGNTTDSYLQELKANTKEVHNQVSDLQHSQFIKKLKVDTDKHDFVIGDTFSSKILPDMGYKPMNQEEVKGVSPDGDFSLIALNKPKGGGHAVAVYTEVKDGAEQYTFFDPNCGFMKFDSKSGMNEFLENFIDAIYGEYSNRKTFNYLSN